MRLDEFYKLTGKGPLDSVTFADLFTLSGEAPPVDEVAVARAKKRAELKRQMDAIDAGTDAPAAPAADLMVAGGVKAPAEHENPPAAPAVVAP